MPGGRVASSTRTRSFSNFTLIVLELTTAGSCPGAEESNANVAARIIKALVIMAHIYKTTHRSTTPKRALLNYRVSSQIQFVSHVLPPSGENDCSIRADFGEIFSHTYRTRTALPFHCC